MGRRSIVSEHPEFEDIEKAFQQNWTLQKISDRFDIPISSLSRWNSEGRSRYTQALVRQAEVTQLLRDTVTSNVDIESYAREISKKTEAPRDSVILKKEPTLWTTADEDYLVVSFGELPIEDIAVTLGRSIPSVRARARLLNLGRVRKSVIAELVSQGVKRCSRCKLVKSLNDFHKNKSGVGGVGNNCMTCQRMYLQERRQADPDRSRDVDYASLRRRKSDPSYWQNRIQWRLNKYNISLERFNEILESQKGQCPGCERDFEAHQIVPAVDHDHSCCAESKSCGECVRGLLCGTCNSALGQVKDSISTLHNLTVYLSDSSSRHRK